ncbi:MAG: polyisoprenoid-binding protein [Frankiales bacterium]|nr:MAG: polyisoprenoid-binding protein [Frankiales bacterium]
MTAPTAVVPAELTGTFTIDPTHSRIGFVARHAMVTKVRGAFTEFSGSATLDATNPSASSAELTIAVASIDTANTQRDEHLRANDFFDAPTYPEITFRSTGVEVLGADTFALTGDLTIKGTTKPVTVEFEHTGVATDPYGNLRAGFEGKAVINRKDWNVSWNAALEAGGVLVSEKITLEFDVSAIRNA